MDVKLTYSYLFILLVQTYKSIPANGIELFFARTCKYHFHTNTSNPVKISVAAASNPRVNASFRKGKPP
ncbi:MAG: hypothetical protein ABJB86_18970 [Bacteroidota bacterium]